MGIRAACIGFEERSIDAENAALVYGEDDRREVYEVLSDAGARATTRAVAAVIPRRNIRYATDGQVTVVAPKLGESERKCEGEPLAEQTSAASCTAVLIDDNLLATVGHCFEHAWDCQNYVFAFDYAFIDESAPQQPGRLDIYECRQTSVQEADVADTMPWSS